MNTRCAGFFVAAMLGGGAGCVVGASAAGQAQELSSRPNTRSASQDTVVEDGFAAVSIRVAADPLSPGRSRIDPLHVHYLHISLDNLIMQAYGLASFQVQWAHAPGWFTDTSFEIDAVTAGPHDQKQMLVLLQGMLRDRFGLTYEVKRKSIPAFEVRIAKGGPKFPALAAGADPSPATGPQLVARNIAELLNDLNGSVGMPGGLSRPLVDGTGLSGDFDIHLTMGEGKNGETHVSDEDFGRLNSLLQDQLGLALHPEKAGFEILEVLQAHMPTEN